MRPEPPAAARILAVAGLALLAGCTPPGTTVTRAAGDSPGETPPRFQPGPGELYRVDPSRSRVVIQVLRGGSLAALGHNHTVAAVPEAGCLVVSSERTRLYVRFRAEELEVDAPADRREAGADFGPQPGADTVARTRRNMLSQAVLDASRYPWIVLTAESPPPAPGPRTLQARMTLRDNTRKLPLPVEVTLGPDGTLHAAGSTAVHQSDFGITPFAVMLGALRVQDRLPVRYRVTAAPAATDASAESVCGLP